MQYFATLPKILTSDNQNNSIILTNLLARASVIDSIMQDPLLYYTYDIQEGDTPEIIAHKYYGDMYRYWIVLMVNQTLDPQWDWPMTGEVFEKYVADKYNFDPHATIHHYEKITQQYDNSTGSSATWVSVIGDMEYNDFTPDTKTYNLPTGQVTVTTSKRAVDYYTYEFEKNESKRNIKLLNKNYASEFETDFKKLMS